jgi:hypothetical protein
MRRIKLLLRFVVLATLLGLMFLFGAAVLFFGLLGIKKNVASAAVLVGFGLSYLGFAMTNGDAQRRSQESKDLKDELQRLRTELSERDVLSVKQPPRAMELVAFVALLIASRSG